LKILVIRRYNVDEINNIAKKIEIIPTGSASLDKLLEGGFRNYSIVEIYGASASGKTRLIHQLLLTASIKLVSENVYLIDNEGSFRPNVLEDIGSRFSQFNKDLLNRIYISRPITVEQFIEALQYLEALKAKFIAIDTLVTHLRHLTMKEYTSYLKEILLKLRSLANNGSFIIFTNQVTTKENALLPVGSKMIDYVVDYKLNLERIENRIKCTIEKPLPKRSETFRITSKGFIGYSERIKYEI
jgi:DNA repair protein RadA